MASPFQEPEKMDENGEKWRGHSRLRFSSTGASQSEAKWRGPFSSAGRLRVEKRSLRSPVRTPGETRGRGVFGRVKNDPGRIARTAENTAALRLDRSAK